MKSLYITLFVVDTIILVALSFLLLKLIDTRANTATLAEMIAGISVSVILLVYLLYRYMKIPPVDRRK